MPWARKGAAKVLNAMFGNGSATTLFTSAEAPHGWLHSATPGVSATASRLASVTAMPIVFNAAASATAVNATVVDWASSSSGTITHISIGLTSALASNSMPLVYGALATTKAYNVGDTIRAASGSIQVFLASAS
jgi:hypothetical protein